MDSVPDTAPAAFGENRTVTLADCPARIASGSAGATTLNRGLLLVMELNVSVAAPPLLIVNVRSFVWPTFTLPKFKEDAPRRMAGTMLSRAVPLNAMLTVARLRSLLITASVPGC